MSSCNYYIPTNATIIPVDTRFTGDKTVFLPVASTVSGRILTIKDQYGTARISSFAIRTLGVDTIDATNLVYLIRSSLGSVTLFSDGLKTWQTLYTVDSLNALQSPFSPSSFSTLAVWLDAKDPWNQGPLSTVVQTDLPIWYDKSGGKRNPFLSSINGTMLRVSTLYSASFPGVSTFVVNFSSKTTHYAWDPSFFSTGDTGTTAFAVLQGFGQYNFTSGVTGISRSYGTDTTNAYNIYYAGSGGVYNNGNTAANFVVASFQWNPITSRSYYRFNGTPVGNLSFNLNSLAGSSQFYLGGSNLGAGQAFRAFGGSYGEFLYFNSPLPSSQVQVVEGYLAWKWGIQSYLNYNHPYRFITPSSYDVSSPA